MGEGVEDLARIELERGEYLSVVCNKETRDGLSQCIVLDMVLSYWPRRREPEVGQPHVRNWPGGLGFFGRDLIIGQRSPERRGVRGAALRTIASHLTR